MTTVVLVLAGSALAVTTKPSITGFKPASAKAGAKVTISGKRFTRVTAVKFAGVKAAFKVNSSTKITATVPRKAKSGKISVTTKRGTAISAKRFTVAVAAAPAPAPTPVATGYAPDGSGTLSTPTTGVSAGSKGNTIVFTFTAATRGTAGAAVTILIPTGWTAPVTTNAPGCTTSSIGTVSTSGQTITVAGLNLSAGATATITYGAVSGAACTTNDGATAPTAVGGNTFIAQEKSTPGGKLTDLAPPVAIAVYAPDGSGTLATATPNMTVSAGEDGDVIAFTYTAAAGGMSGGSLTIVVPAGWTAPVTTNAKGCTTSSAGTVATSGMTITVSGVTLAAAATATITYGATSGGACTTGDGASAPNTTGTSTFNTQQKSTQGGTLAAIAESPTVRVT